MKRQWFWCWIVPTVVCVLYGLSLWVPTILPIEKEARDRWLIFYNSEFGPVENISWMVYAVIGVMGLIMAARLKKAQPDIPVIWRIWFRLFAIGAILMGLEEISYGQHFIGFTSPDWFETASKQQEVNLHNLYGDKPARILRRLIEVGMPIFGIAIPLACMAVREAWTKPRFGFYIFPRLEMVMWTLLAALVTPVRKLSGLTSVPQWRGSLSEFQEMLWACALLIYLCVMWQRLLKHRDEAKTPIEKPDVPPR